MPPPGYEPFLRAICENPEDDTVRLVYADWLDENGDPERAEFIRVSVEWARTLYPSERWQHLREQVTSRVKKHGEQWLGEFPQSAGVSWDTGFPWGPFERGLPGVVAVLSSRAFATVADRLFALAPIRHVIFPRIPLAQIREALECPAVAAITEFTIIWTSPNQPGDELCGVLAGLSHLRRLQGLVLDRKGITDLGAAALARAPFLPQLYELCLVGNPISEEGLMRVVDQLTPEWVYKLALPAAQLSETTRNILRERFGRCYLRLS